MTELLHHLFAPMREPELLPRGRGERRGAGRRARGRSMSEYEPEEYDPGPAVDDEGGMSEYRPDWSEVEWAEWERDHEPTRNGDLSERCAGERLPPFDHIPGVDPWTREPDEWSEVDRLAAEREAWGGEPPGPGCYPYADWVAEGRQEGPEAGA